MSQYSIDDYIARRNTCRNEDYAEYLISAATSADHVLSLAQEYLNELILSTDNYYDTITKALSSIQFVVKGSTISQPIVGFKEVRIGYRSDTADNQEGLQEADSSIFALSNIYKQHIDSISANYKLSSVFDVNDTGKFNFLTTKQIICQNKNIPNTIICASDMAYYFKSLMQTLSNIRKIKVNVYYKYVDQAGNMAVAICDKCAIPMYSAADDVRGSDGGIKIKVRAAGGYAWRLHVSPYALHNYTQPKQAIVDGDIIKVTDDAYGSNLQMQTYSNALMSSTDSIAELYSVGDYFSDVPSFDNSKAEGSNGNFTAYKIVTTKTFDLAKFIDVESMFNIQKGSKIEPIDVISAITYIFELWRKNIQTIQYDIYVCHYNCHGNNINYQPMDGDSTKDMIEYVMTYYDDLDKKIGTSPRYNYESLDGTDAPFYWNINYKNVTQLLDVNCPPVYMRDTNLSTYGSTTAFYQEFKITKATTTGKNTDPTNGKFMFDNAVKIDGLTTVKAEYKDSIEKNHVGNINCTFSLHYNSTNPKKIDFSELSNWYNKDPEKGWLYINYNDLPDSAFNYNKDTKKITIEGLEVRDLWSQEYSMNTTVPSDIDVKSSGSALTEGSNYSLKISYSDTKGFSITLTGLNLAYKGTITFVRMIPKVTIDITNTPALEVYSGSYYNTLISCNPYQKEWPAEPYYSDSSSYDDISLVLKYNGNIKSGQLQSKWPDFVIAKVDYTNPDTPIVPEQTIGVQDTHYTVAYVNDNKIYNIQTNPGDVKSYVEFKGNDKQRDDNVTIKGKHKVYYAIIKDEIKIVALDDITWIYPPEYNDGAAATVINERIPSKKKMACISATVQKQYEEYMTQLNLSYESEYNILKSANDFEISIIETATVEIGGKKAYVKKMRVTANDKSFENPDSLFGITGYVEMQFATYTK